MRYATRQKDRQPDHCNFTLETYRFYNFILLSRSNANEIKCKNFLHLFQVVTSKLGYFDVLLAVLNFIASRFECTVVYFAVSLRVAFLHVCLMLQLDVFTSWRQI